METEPAWQHSDVTRLRLGILGASGFLGQAIVDFARSRGAVVTEISAPRLTFHGPRRPDLPAIDRFTPIISALASKLAGLDAVINAAGISDAGSDDSDELYGANSLLPLALAHACAQAAVPRFIHLSSSAVQGRGILDESNSRFSFSPYSHSKALGELWLEKTSNIETVCLRPTSVHGHGRAVTRSVVRLAASRTSSIAGGDERATPQTRVETVAAAAVFIAGYRGTPPKIALTPDEGLTTAYFLELIGGRKPTRIPHLIASGTLSIARALGGRSPRLSSTVRRLEMLWFGQRRVPGWLSQFSGLVGPIEGWQQLRVNRTSRDRPRVLFGVTTGLSVRGFFTGQHAFLSECGWDVFLTCSRDGDPGEFSRQEGAEYLELTASRNPNPVGDARTLVQLIKHIRRVKPDVAVWGTPKVGMLGAIASTVTRTPSIYVVHGLRLETARKGLPQATLRFAERLACSRATTVVAVGNQLRERLIDLEIAPAQKISVLQNGSANGIQTDAAKVLRHTDKGFGVVGYVGRVTPDKGLWDLLHAWPQVRCRHPLAQLWVIGATESDAESIRLAVALESEDGISLLGHNTSMNELYGELDILVLPSHREGLPNVVLEAAVAGVPAIATDATGAGESIISGRTGLIVGMRRPRELANAIDSLLSDTELRLRMGTKAREYVLNTYAQKPLWSSWERLIRSTGEVGNLSSKGI
uniref:glycosyltransferase n=1 Tax=Georgenia sp. M64 TaxID=3120520 RepID=UPI0040492E81